MKIEADEAFQFGSPYSETYAQARERFRAAADDLGADSIAYPLTNDSALESGSPPDLTIDVAILRSKFPSTMVLSSGLHGVEGMMGSAVQLATMQKLTQRRRDLESSFVFIHTINPYGFSCQRRFDENNIDLNRNFLADFESLPATPTGYQRLNRFLNPDPTRFVPPWETWFYLRSLWILARYGLQPLKQAIAGGQYEYPNGIFYGGPSPAESTSILQKEYAGWIGDSTNVIHLDFHSGLGKYGDYSLLPPPSDSLTPESIQWYQETFGKEKVFQSTTRDGVSYRAEGSMGQWLSEAFRDRDFRFLTLEFGTYHPLRVLGAIRRENQTHQNAKWHPAASERSKLRLLECFCPVDQTWRQGVIASSDEVIAKAIRALQQQG